MRDRDLEQRFESLDLLDVPDQWRTIEAEANVPKLHPAALSWQPVRVVLVAAALTVLLFGGVFLLRGPITAPDPVVTEPPATTLPATTVPQTTAPTTTTPVTATTLPVLLPDIGIGWSKVPYDFDLFGGGFGGGLTAVTHGGPGLVTVGRTCGELDQFGSSVCEPGAWVSADAVTWQRAPGGKDVFGNVILEDVAAGPSGIVAVGVCERTAAAACDPGIWFSPDGMTWDPVELSTDTFKSCSTTSNPRDCYARLRTVVAGGPGFVTVGFDVEGPGIWASADGREWTRVADSGMFPESTSTLTTAGYFEILDLAMAGPRIIAIGQYWTDVFDDNGEWISSTTGTYMWTSLDGITWEPVPDPDGVLASSGIRRPIAWDGGFAAVGYACIEGETCEVVWTSPDGLTWNYTRLPSLDEGMSIRDVSAGNPGLIVWGESNTTDQDENTTDQDENPLGFFWTSSDGIAWQRHTADADVFGFAVPINEFIWYEDVLIGVGVSHEDRAPAIYRWNP